MSTFGNTPTTTDYGGAGNFTVLTGTGPPTDATAALGEFYIDTQTNTLYGPKMAPGSTFYGPNVRATQQTPDGTTNLGGAMSLGSWMTITSTTGARAVALRFHKASGGVAGSSRSLRLYILGGTLVASTTTSNETIGGWQEAPLATPVTLNYATSYVVVYDWPEGLPVSYGGTVSSASTVITYGGCRYQGAIGGYPTSAGSATLGTDMVVQVTTTGSWPTALKSAP